MKRTHKRALGALGLVMVAATTAFAAFVPAPKTQAVTSSVTDTVTVRVVAPTTNVYITKPSNGSVFTSPNQTVTYNYEHTVRVTTILEYTDEDGHLHRYEVKSIDTPDEYGTGMTDIDLSIHGHGYGDYVIRVIGEGKDGVPHPDSVKISYLQVTGSVEADTETGDANLTLHYSDQSSDIDKLRIDVYDKDGNFIQQLSSIMVTPPGKDVKIPFSKTDLLEGQYIIRITALDINGSPLQDAYDLTFYYKPAATPGEAPNTGGLFTGLNISQADYLITGLLVFSVVGILGIVYIIRGKKNQKR